MSIYAGIFAAVLCVLIFTEFVDAKKCCKKPTKKYYISKNRTSNDDAHQMCVKNGFQLASIKSENERLAFEEALSFAGIADDEENGRTWIAGLYQPDRKPSSSMWTWHLSDELYLREPMNYTNWYQGFPNGQTNDTCVYSSIKAFSFKWSITNCDKKYFVACELRI